MSNLKNSPLLLFNQNQKKLTEALSAVLSMGEHLWVASDELTSVERLSTRDGLTFSEHETFPLENFIHLPALGQDVDQEIDIEGLAYQDNYLWIAGSHSLKRKKVKIDDDGTVEKKIKRLSKIDDKGNRYILARIPVINNANGVPELVWPDDAASTLRPAQLAGDIAGNALTEAIKKEDAEKSHLATFMSLPGKDNGFDIEGLAVAGDKVFLGLRGPVLRGWAVILELEVETNDSSQLTLKEIGTDGRPYRKHFLDLGGLGVRELCRDGSDLLVLAGPTMNLDGPVVVCRWKDAINKSTETLIGKNDLKPLFRIPHGDGTDHAEGITLLQTENQTASVLVVYDSPSAERKEGDNGVRADVFELLG